MKNIKSLLKFEILSAIFVMVLGTILHFTYDLSNKNVFVGCFSAVNESTWEHLKLLFFPMLLTTIFGYFHFKNEYSNYLCGKTQGILYSMIFTTIFFYSYTGIIGSNIDILNIASFFIAVILDQITSFKYIISDQKCNKKIAIITLALLLICFIIFTFAPPHIGLFKDPLNGSYGIQKS